MSASQRGPSRTAFCHRRPPGPRPPPHSCKAGTGPRHVAASLEPRQAGPGQTGRRPGADGFPEAQMVVGGSGDCPPDWWSVQAERMSPGSSHGSSRGVSSSHQESPPGRCVPGEGAWGVRSLWLCPEIALGPGPGHPTRAALFSHRSVCVGLWKCRAGNNALPGHSRESRGPAQLHLGARSAYLPLDPTAGPAPTTFLWGMFPARPPCTGLHVGRECGSAVCSPLCLSTSGGRRLTSGRSHLPRGLRRSRSPTSSPRSCSLRQKRIQAPGFLGWSPACQHSPLETVPGGPSWEARCWGSKWSRNDAKEVGSFPYSPWLG